MIGIITDSHENIPAIEAAVKVLKEKNPELVIHCGDIISPPVLERFKGLPMLLVFGNNDGEQEGLTNKVKALHFKGIQSEQEFKIDNKKIFVCHGHRKGILRKAIESRNYDYILTGHTHTLRDETIETTRIINVGCLFQPLGGQDFYSIGLLDVKSDKLDVVKFNMETLELK